MPANSEKVRSGRVLLWTAALVGLAASGAAAGGQQRPNIVLFLVDDMGWQDTSVPFHSETTPLDKRYRTPNMERLAAAGMKFTQAYACCVCSPSRVSLLTGLNAARHRVTNWTLKQDVSPDAKHPTLELPAWNHCGVSPAPNAPHTVCAATLPGLLRTAGYRTIHLGKAHFGAIGAPGADPRNLGFDVNIAGHAAGGPGSYLGEQNYSAAWRKGGHVWDVPHLEAYHGSNVFLTEALTREANREIDRAAADGKPFFLYLSHYAVHVPYAADPRFVAKYRDAGLDETEAMYAALVEGMDRSLGDVLANVERHGLSARTIVLFMSDNGGLSVHGRGGEPNTHNRPLASGKGSALEGGLRVPMIVRWPGVTPPGSVCRQPVIIEDFFPSILEMAGAARRETGVDGRSFAPLLRNPDAERANRPLVWHFPNCWGPKGPGIGPFSAVRSGDWKLIYYHHDQHCELYDLANDLSEEHNLADAKPEQTERLKAELGRYLASVRAVMPRVRQTGQIVPYPGGVAGAIDGK